MTGNWNSSVNARDEEQRIGSERRKDVHCGPTFQIREPYMMYVVAAIIAVTAFALVAFPLFQRREEPELALQPLDIEVDDLHSRREAVYSAIKELDFEYQLGNLSQDDYQDLRNQYRQKAASVLKEMDEISEVTPQSPDDRPTREDEIEEVVRSLRAKGGQKPARSKAKARFCPQCGAPAGQADHFCASCGSSLTRACGGCGAGLEPGDSFCPVCGARAAKGGK